MPTSHTLGFPPLGAARELKRATEGYWRGTVSRADLLRTGAELRARHWRLQHEAGIDLPPSNDFSFYDRMLDTCAMVGAVPSRYAWNGPVVDLDTYFAMARGSQQGGRDVTAMEMTKWFDTNYHYIVPELTRDQSFRLASSKAVDEFSEASALGIRTTPVLIGPVTFLLLAKEKGARFDRLDLLDRLLPVYGEVLQRLAAAGAEWVQVDEPCLALDRTPEELERYRAAYGYLAERSSGARILLATYFAGLDDNAATALALPTHGLHVDLVRAPGQLDALLERWPAGRVLSAGVVDGRNIWRTDLDAALNLLERAQRKAGPDLLWVAPSCSLLHVPIDLALETGLDPEIKPWLAFATQKLGEVATLTRGLRDGRGAVEPELAESRQAAAARRASPLTLNAVVRQHVAAVQAGDLKRATPFTERRRRQLELPRFPTTTIGSFPQTSEVRAARRRFTDGQMSQAEYERFIEEQITKTLALQEEIGLDVLVHGEFERNDMVEYFGEQLAGFAFTEHGWVQSYGTRYVKPPIIFGDVARPGPMTVRWSAFAQSQDQAPREGHAHRTGDDPAVVVRARRSAAERDGAPAGAGDPRRGEGPRGRRDPHHSDRRAGAAGGDAAAACRVGGVSGLGRERFPARDERRGRRDPDPHPHVLQRVQRRDSGDRPDGCGRHLDRERALGIGAVTGVRAVSLSERDRAGRLRHPLAPGAGGRGDRRRAPGAARGARSSARSGSIPIAA